MLINNENVIREIHIFRGGLSLGTVSEMNIKYLILQYKVSH